MKRARRTVPFLAVVTAVIVALAVGIAAALGTEADNLEVGRDLVSPPPSRAEMAAERQAAAAADLAGEQQRVSAANAAWEVALQSSPGTRREYVVSFLRPLPAVDVLRSVDSEGPTVETLHTWLLAPGSSYPKTGSWQLDEFGPDADPEQVAAVIAEDTLHYLSEREAAIARLAERPEGPDGPAVNAQLAEIVSLRAQIKSKGIMSYAVTCLCSPSEIVSLDTKLGGVLRMAEEASGIFPLPPQNPLRDSLMSGEG